MSDVQDTLITTLRELVAIDSTSTLSNAPMVAYLEPRLVAAGFRCQRYPYVDEAGVEKVNLLGLRGEAPDGVAELALVGHTDCVPYDAAWTDALRLTAQGEKLFGRGACDTKAFIACILTAVARVPASAQERPLMALFTADEELGCVGAKKLVDAAVGRARHAIVGEPTSLTPVRAHKGYCLAEVEVHGKEGHSAYPETGASAIFRAARLLSELQRYAQGELRVMRDESFEPPFTTVNVGTVQGGRAKNVIPASCRFVVEWRPIPSQPVDGVWQRLEGLVAELAQQEPGFSASLKLLRADRGVDTPSDARLVRFLEAQSGRRSTTVPFGTEAPQLTALGAEAVVFGPGDIRVAHQTGEFVPVSELLQAEAVVERAIHAFCGKG